MGDTSVRLSTIRGASVDAGLLERIAAAATLPKGPVLLLAGVHGLDGKRLGECAPRFLFPLLPGHWRRRQHLDWEVGIALSGDACSLSFTYPAFFAQIVAHELSHARLALKDRDLHVYCCFLDKYIRKASDNRVTRWHELPHEQVHDAFGLAIAAEVLGAEKLKSDLCARLSDPTEQGIDRIRFLQQLQPSQDISGLQEKTRSFARPYAEALSRLWDEEVGPGVTSVANYAPHIGSFLQLTGGAHQANQRLERT